jgi:hypothetical protein
MRAPLPAGAICALALLAGCGGGGGTDASGPPVRLTVASPSDLAAVRTGTVEVRGTVRPATATVKVAGEPAPVSGGSFSADVSLEPGVNVIDVLAAAGDDRPALTAVRVRRLLTVTVPDVTGLSTADARTALEGAGFRVDVKRSGGLLDELLGGEPAVCETSPAPGDEADAGSTVEVTVARHC